ncbi:hypothetical protein MASR2M15_23390 [Anaerolineales bacterium]
MRQAMIIDTDTASDDAVALIMALRHPAVDVKAICVVAGNVPVDQGVKNALYVTELCGQDVPVYRGAEEPLQRKYHHAQWFHGSDGLGDQHYPAAKRSAEPMHAVDALIAHIRANPACILVTLGPLTNVALAVKQAPDIVKLVDRCVVMGGAACTYGNVTPAAEYNIWVDPEAARIVFLSGMAVEMVGWEFCQGEFALNHAEIDELQALGTPLSRFTLDSNRTATKAYEKQAREQALSLPDPVAMAVALDPTICTRSSRHYVEIETHSELTRGMTVVDKLDVAYNAECQQVWQQAIEREAKVSVCWELDAKRWKALLKESLI